MILVFGKSGQVANELQALLSDAIFLDRNEVDLAVSEACISAIYAARPSAVINAAAYTAVDKAEEDEATALLINGIAPTAMANTCAELGIPFVHLSTDYVFSGSGDSSWATADVPDPVNAYGRTKLFGEQGICASGATYAILRTSWVFSAHGANFVKTMLRLSETHNALKVVVDQFGGPTPARAIAEACAKIVPALWADPALSGIYHFSGSPNVSWADFAREIFTQSGRSVTVTDIPTSAYLTPAKRPLNSRLDCSELEVFGLVQPEWRKFLKVVLEDLERI